MCRIAGFIDFNYRGNYSIEETIITMRDTLAYGGPDDAGLYFENNKGLAMGHRRLSILDLSSLGHQPMSNDDRSLWISYNGEVYNFVEIKAELEALGFRFHSNSDTEVVLKAYQRWGIDAVHKFRGMWAFAIWDVKKEKLILCRDRVGVKPLFYYWHNGLFMFSSELKAFHKHPGFIKELDKNSLSLYFQYGYVPAPASIFKYTYKLEPGYFLEVDIKQHITKNRYWNVFDYYLEGVGNNNKQLKRSEEEIALELEDILKEAFKLRMVSDVPVGVFLSGGIDSSLTTAILQKEYSNPLKTFTIGFHEKEYNEANWAKKIAKYLGTDHAELYCTQKETQEVIPKLSELYDEPFGDSSAVPTYLVSMLAKQKVKVSLSAEGGDELFCGYSRYWMLNSILKKINLLPNFLRKRAISIFLNISPGSAVKIYNSFKFLLPELSNPGGKYVKLINALECDEQTKQYLSMFAVFSDTECVELGLPLPKHNLDINSYNKLDCQTAMMYTDFSTYLPDDLLVKLDRATMSVALEGREPFLDNKIIEYAAGLPVGLKYKNHTSKYILRKILYKYVPKELLDRPKSGFGVPFFKWFKNDLKGYYLEALNIEKIKKQAIFNHVYVKKLLESYFNNQETDHYKLWFLYSFQLWAEKWLV